MNDGSPGEGRAPVPRRARRAAAGPLALAVALAVWAGCSVQKHYKILSFFFDGVPDPAAKKASSADGLEGVADAKSSPTYTAHQPWVQDQCVECHSSRFRLTRANSGLCLKCHDEQTSNHRHMHGPVAAVACLWCHSPHDSAYAFLLRGESRSVCTQCHEAGDLRTDTVPAHADIARNCLECHHGHGSEGRFLLRPGYSTQTPPVPAEPPP